MAFISSLVLYLIASSFTFGQLFRLNINNIDFPLIDILIVILAIINIYQHFKSHTLKLDHHPWIYFLLLSWILLAINLWFRQLSPLIPLLYLIRLSGLLTLLIWPPIIPAKPRFHQFLQLAIISNLIFGLIQYFFWPDFTYFSSLNWDPHLYRLVSTFFDPTFTALIYLLFILNLYFSKTKLSFTKFLLLFITYLAFSLTYSRSAYLSFIVTFAYISFVKKNKIIFFISLILISTSVFLLPRLPGEGTKLERTSSIKAKIINYQQGVRLFIQSPIIGYGYNTLGAIRSDINPNSHANYGFDSSLLTILVTNGIFGFILFIAGLFKYWHHHDLYYKATLVAVLCHSLFSNSLLYPWILLFIILT